MSDPHRPEPSLRIQTPCPKSWEELAGGDLRRYCGECGLHVHNAAALTRAEAERLVRGASERVCMRIAYDASGQPIHREEPGSARAEPAPSAPTRWAAWALSAAAGMLAACPSEPCPDSPPAPAAGTGAASTSLLGWPAATELVGDVLLPSDPVQVVLGEAVCPTPPEAPGAPSKEER